MENHETVCSVFHTEQTPSPQQFRDPVGGLWLTQPRVPEWNSWDPSGACSRANPASRHKLDTNYTLDVSMCEQRMQETCWTWRKHFWSLEAHRLKLFAKVQHVIGRVAVHWEASKSETGQSTRWRTFFAFKSTVSFSGNSLFSSETVRETCVFFSPGYSEIHDISDIKMRVKQTSVAFTSNTPEFPGLMFCPGTTASFTVPWQLESTESIFQFRFLQMFYIRIHCVSNIGFPMQWLLWTSFSSSLLVWSRFQGVQHRRIAADTLHPGMAVALTITTKGRL